MNICSGRVFIITKIKPQAYQYTISRTMTENEV